LIDSKNVANMLIAIRVVDAGLLIAPWLYVARSSRLSIRVRDGLTAVGIVVLFYVAGVQHSDGFGVISNLLTLGLAVTLFIQGESSGKK
jgi:hypothetical protein